MIDEMYDICEEEVLEHSKLSRWNEKRSRVKNQDSSLDRNYLAQN